MKSSRNEQQQAVREAKQEQPRLHCNKEQLYRTRIETPCRQVVTETAKRRLRSLQNRNIRIQDMRYPRHTWQFRTKDFHGSAEPV
ncbi:hypothetical protein HPP92_002702 [Vanilla planifolia]|uniref:Uncharacterized protein n=1 Tax=Vanilla planifolia TaxID=51239 RepID=A0A835VIR1_VANPL|nr:hypothetical protein HPP92_002702 [Vanilla planifolia]